MMTAMQKDFKEDAPSPQEPKSNPEQEIPLPPKGRQSVLSGWMNGLVQMGVGESILRAGTNLFSIIAIAIVVWLVQMFYRQTPSLAGINTTQASSPAPTAAVDINSIPAMDDPVIAGVSRGAQIHTNIPS